MNEQIRWITGLLDAHRIPYWIDSGTLLGLMREGDLLKPNEDIDIGVWSRYEPRIRSILPLIREAGLAIRAMSYKHLIYSYKFLPKFIDSRSRLGAIVEVNLYRIHGDYAWCPEIFQINPNAPGSVRYHLDHLIRNRLLLGVLVGDFLPTRFISWWATTDVSSLLWHTFLDVGTWWIPRFYLDNTVLIRDFGVLVPRDWQSYLEFRYGDWKTRVEEWQYWRDDGGFRRMSPHEIIKNVIL